jgi:hypothetical protein
MHMENLYPKCCVLNKNRTMDNVQKHNSCINILLPQTFRSYLDDDVNFSRAWENIRISKFQPKRV